MPRTEEQTDEKLVQILKTAAESTDNVLDIVTTLGETFKCKLFTVTEFVQRHKEKTGRTISDATVRVLLAKGKIDGLYKPDSSNLKYLVLLTQRTNQYKFRTYKKSKK